MLQKFFYCFFFQKLFNIFFQKPAFVLKPEIRSRVPPKIPQEIPSGTPVVILKRFFFYLEVAPAVSFKVFAGISSEIPTGSVADIPSGIFFRSPSRNCRKSNWKNWKKIAEEIKKKNAYMITWRNPLKKGLVITLEIPRRSSWFFLARFQDKNSWSNSWSYLWRNFWINVWENIWWNF